MRQLPLIAVMIGILLPGQEAPAQATRSLPYSGQLRTDPSVGNVQGTQRYGRPLKTDPDQGEGFSYHVYPVAHPEPAIVQAGLGKQQLSADASGEIANLDKLIQAAERQRDAAETPEEEDRATRTLQGARIDRLEKVLQSGVAAAPVTVSAGVPYSTPYPAPFDWTSGVRNFPLGGGPASPFVDLPPQARAERALIKQGLLQERALAFRRAEGEAGLYEIFHQPLIQIKMRVVEVERTDELAANSILEYVSVKGSKPSLTTGDPLNKAFENFRGITKFGIEGLMNGTTGAGGLVNLTAEHINWVAAVLAAEFNADIITAPEMVTLNGQNVEFVAGSKEPFQLGQNVIQGSNNNIQQVFYKHVGTMVSVTPTIVNWGYHGEGGGEGAISAQEIEDWNLLAEWMLTNNILDGTKIIAADKTEYVPAEYGITAARVVPFKLKSELLKTLNRHDRQKTPVALDGCKCIASNEFYPVWGLAWRPRSVHSTHCYERSSISNAIRQRPATKSAV